MPDNYAVTNATVSVARDDGVVVYVNGAEAARDNMLGGPVTYSTRAEANAADEQLFYNLPVNAALFRAGTNAIAAEVHQINSGSGDIGFNLSLRGDGYFASAMPSPTLSVEMLPPDVVRIWFPASNGVRCAIDASEDLQTWQPMITNTVIGGLFEYSATFTNPPARFFRARQVP